MRASCRRSSWVVFLLILAVSVAELKAADHEMLNVTRTQGDIDISVPLADLLAPDQANETTEAVGRNETTITAVVTNSMNRYNGRGWGGGGGYGWGWGGGGGGGGGGGRGGGGRGGGWGWGGGGGGGGYYKWGCAGGKRTRGSGSNTNSHRVFHGKRGYTNEYKIGEYAQCMYRGRCRGMRLDCPLHCAGPCFYDCQYMCKAHCRKP